MADNANRSGNPPNTFPTQPAPPIVTYPDPSDPWKPDSRTDLERVAGVPPLNVQGLDPMKDLKNQAETVFGEKQQVPASPRPSTWPDPFLNTGSGSGGSGSAQTGGNDKRYTVTVYVAAPGTPLYKDGKQIWKDGTPEVSNSGHMFYVLSDGTNKASFGFAPIKQGSPYGEGSVQRNDLSEYHEPRYAKTMEISKEQYDRMYQFGENPKNFNFNLTYSIPGNNCVDYTWKALNLAGIERKSLGTGEGVESGLFMLYGAGPKKELPGKGQYNPIANIGSLKELPYPMPNSNLNGEKFNKLPWRDPNSLIQWGTSRDVNNEPLIKPDPPIKTASIDPGDPATSATRSAFAAVTTALMNGNVADANRVAAGYVDQSAEAQAGLSKAQEIEVAKNAQPDSPTRDEGFSRS